MILLDIFSNIVIINSRGFCGNYYDFCWFGYGFRLITSRCLQTKIIFADIFLIIIGSLLITFILHYYLRGVNKD